MRKVILSKLANDKLAKILKYLEQEWGQTSKRKFLSNLSNKLSQLQKFPESGKKSEKFKGLYQSVLSKQTSIWYKFDEHRLFIITFFDTRQHPNKLNKEV